MKKNKKQNNVFGIIVERRSSTIAEESFRSSCFRQKADNRTSCYCNIFENVVCLCENSNALAHFRFFAPLIRIGSHFFWASNENINVNWKRNWRVFFEATILFLILFTEVLINKKPHGKTTEEVKILLLTITILNTENYRTVKRELKTLPKKKTLGPTKKIEQWYKQKCGTNYTYECSATPGTTDDWFK